MTYKELEFDSIKVVKTTSHRYNAHIDKVFPLICPIREMEWLDEWQTEMIYSESGFIEEGCVFRTKIGDQITLWTVTKHDTKNHEIEYIESTRDRFIVRVNINLSAIDENNTIGHYRYEFTSLSEDASLFLEYDLKDFFDFHMRWWETALNYYLENGEMLKKF